ncbi:MAG: hypothetical protein IPJ03_14885 [Ignavibacteriales bacterium]|nr:hypothetical protein [Ignavibacteriales bacterium]
MHSDSLFQSYSEPQGFPNDVIYGMLEDEHGKLWTTTNSGIAVFDMNEANVIRTFDLSDGLQSNEFNQNGFLKIKTVCFFRELMVLISVTLIVLKATNSFRPLF